MTRSTAVLVAVLFACASRSEPQTARRPIRVDDLPRFASVSDPQRSPEGAWVAYTVSTTNVDKDKRNTDIWMVKWDGSEQVQLTSSEDSENSPRFSPDGKYLAFLSSRGNEEEKKKGAQIWLLNRAGGEAIKVSDLKGGAEDIQWSPDSKRIAFIANDFDVDSDPEKKEGWKRKTATPIVLDRYRFKEDVSGYLKRLYGHVAVFDVATRTATTITTGQADDESPSWSPDGTQIAFLSKRAEKDPDRTGNDDVWVVEARAGAEPRRVTATEAGENGRPRWSPDGTRIAVLLGDVDKYSAYGLNRLMVVNVPKAGGAAVSEPTAVLPQLDRAVSSPEWSADGKRLTFLVQDDRTVNLAAVAVGANGKLETLTTGKRVVRSPSGNKDGNFAVIATTPSQPGEVYALEAGKLRQLTKHNDALIAELEMASVEDFQSKSADSTEVHGLIVKPAGYKPGTKYPTILYIHGGPNGQDEHAWSFDRQLFAANGYVVLLINYRGSAGRGSAFQKAIFADWGHFEVVDLLGAVDEAVKQGIADPDRLGIGGWSYGGISTNYTIATDPRFKAAISGAGSSLQLTMYGVDRYTLQYDLEITPPWKNPDLWMKISYPFFHADRIKTPTLFLGGEKDFNVPLVGGEQMYQALKSLGVETQLVIYPGQYHGITMPSYERDRLQRYLDWYGKFLKPGAGAAQPAK